MTLDGLNLDPKPGAAPFARMVFAQTSIELRLLMRNGEQILLTLIIPVLLLIAGTKADSVVNLGPGRSIDIVTPGVLALAVLSTSFTSLAIATGFERRYGVLKRLGATPLPRSGLVLGKVCAIIVLECAQLLIISAIALSLGWKPTGALWAWAWFVVSVILATWAFAALGLLIAGTLRAEATLAVANLVYVVLLVGGAVLVPVSQYPAGVDRLVTLLPSGAFGEGLRDALSAAAPGLMPSIVLVAWAGIATILVSRTFKWE